MYYNSCEILDNIKTKQITPNYSKQLSQSTVSYHSLYNLVPPFLLVSKHYNQKRIQTLTWIVYTHAHHTHHWATIITFRIIILFFNSAYRCTRVKIRTHWSIFIILLRLAGGLLNKHNCFQSIELDLHRLTHSFSKPGQGNILTVLRTFLSCTFRNAR